MDSLDNDLKAKKASITTALDSKDNKTSTNTPAKLNLNATSNYLNVVGQTRGLLAESHLRTFNQLSNSLTSYLNNPSELDSFSQNSSSNSINNYAKLTSQVINRDPSLQEKVAQDLSTSKQLVRSRDAASTLENNIKNLPTALQESNPAGKNLSKFICQSVVNLSDYENMGAGLQRDLAIREVYPPKSDLSFRAKEATSKALNASIAYVKSNQPEVLNSIKNENVVTTQKPGSTTPQIMTRYLRQALNEFPENSTYLDIFKKNKDKTTETQTDTQDNVSKETFDRIKNLISKAADTARRGNLLPGGSGDEVSNTQSNQKENVVKEKVQSQANSASIDDASNKSDAKQLSLSELSARAAKLQQQFREERLKIAQEGKLPDPAKFVQSDVDTNEKATSTNNDELQKTHEKLVSDFGNNLKSVKESLEKDSKATNELVTKIQDKVTAQSEITQKLASKIDEQVASQSEITKELASKIDKQVASQSEITKELTSRIDKQVASQSEITKELTSRIEKQVESQNEITKELASKINEQVASQNQMAKDLANKITEQVATQSQMAKDLADRISEQVSAQNAITKEEIKQIARDAVKEAISQTVKSEVEATVNDHKKVLNQEFEQKQKILEEQLSKKASLIENDFSNVVKNSKVNISYKASSSLDYGSFAKTPGLTVVDTGYDSLSFADESQVQDYSSQKIKQNIINQTAQAELSNTSTEPEAVATDVDESIDASNIKSDEIEQEQDNTTSDDVLETLHENESIDEADTTSQSDTLEEENSPTVDDDSSTLDLDEDSNQIDEQDTLTSDDIDVDDSQESIDNDDLQSDSDSIVEDDNNVADEDISDTIEQNDINEDTETSKVISQNTDVADSDDVQEDSTIVNPFKVNNNQNILSDNSQDNENTQASNETNTNNLTKAQVETIKSEIKDEQVEKNVFNAPFDDVEIPKSTVEKQEVTPNASTVDKNVATVSLDKIIADGLAKQDQTNLGNKILQETVPSDELEDSMVPSDADISDVKNITSITAKDDDITINSIPSKTEGAAAITSGRSEPIPTQSVVDNSNELKEKSGLFSKIASLFSKKDKGVDSIQTDNKVMQVTSASNNLIQFSTRTSPLDNLMYALKVQISNPSLPEKIKEQAKDYLDKLESPVDDLPSVSNWLNFVSGPMSPSSPQALAMHQWAFMLLAIRFNQLGKSVDKFLKKKVDLMEDKFDKPLDEISKSLDKETLKNLSELTDQTLEQITRFQNPQKEGLPLIYQYIPLPPTYEGGREGGMNIQPVIGEDGKKSWHLNFVFDLKDLGPIEIKGVAKLPELKLSVVASTFDGLQKVQSSLPLLKDKLSDIGIITSSATARLGKVHLSENTASNNQKRNDGSSFSVDI